MTAINNTILITGASGQLGNALSNALSKGRTEIGPVKLINSRVIETDARELDITDFTAVSGFIREHNPGIIINCAAMTDVDGCESDYGKAFKINALGPRNLAVAAREHGAKLIHISTDYVFPGTGDKPCRPYLEWDIPAPASVYGKSKLLGEQYVSRFCQRHFIVRTAWLYGHAGGNFVKSIVNLAKTKDSIKVVDDQKGNPTYAGDLAYHLLKLAVSEEYGLYHCVGAGECSRFEFAKEIVRLSGSGCEVLPCSTVEFPRPAPRPAYSGLRNLALACSIGDDMRAWREALKDFFHNKGEL